MACRVSLYPGRGISGGDAGVLTEKVRQAFSPTCNGRARTMARRKEDITQADLDALAERAQDLAIEIGRAADTVSVTQTLRTAEPAAKFNQLVEACGHMNRMLLGLARLVDDRANIEAKLRERAAATQK